MLNNPKTAPRRFALVFHMEISPGSCRFVRAFAAFPDELILNLSRCLQDEISQNLKIFFSMLSFEWQWVRLMRNEPSCKSFGRNKCSTGICVSVVPKQFLGF